MQVQRIPFPSGATPIDPATKSPTALWDVSDISTLWQDTAATTAVTATGQSVARISDKSGNGNNLTQATAGRLPTYQIDSNGFPYLLFDGVDDFLAKTLTLTLPFDRLSAVQQIAWTLNHYLWWAASSSGHLYQNAASPQLRVLLGTTSNALQNSGLAVGQPGVVVERNAANASRLGVNNGALTGPNDVGAVAPTSLNLGATSTATSASNIRFYAGTLKIAGGFADADIPGIAAWLGVKQGLTL